MLKDEDTLKYPTTKKTLIDRLQDGDDISWNEFYEQYNSIIVDIGRAKGLTEDECNDLVQEVMLRFFKNSTTLTFTIIGCKKFLEAPL